MVKFWMKGKDESDTFSSELDVSYKNYYALPTVKGIKQELGPGKNYYEPMNDLSRWHDRLESIMGTHLIKLFTSPWNQCNF